MWRAHFPSEKWKSRVLMDCEWLYYCWCLPERRPSRKLVGTGSFFGRVLTAHRIRRKFELNITKIIFLPETLMWWHVTLSIHKELEAFYRRFDWRFLVFPWMTRGSECRAISLNWMNIASWRHTQFSTASPRTWQSSSTHSRIRWRQRQHRVASG